MNKEIEISPRQIAEAITDLLNEKEQLQQENKELHNKIDISIGILKTWKDFCEVKQKYCVEKDKEHWTYCIEKLEGLEDVLKDSDVDDNWNMERHWRLWRFISNK